MIARYYLKNYVPDLSGRLLLLLNRTCAFGAPVRGELLVDLSHSVLVVLGDQIVVHHGDGVVRAHDALGRLLHLLRGVPRLVDVAGGVVLQDGKVTPDKEERERKIKIRPHLNILKEPRECSLQLMLT